MHRSIASLVSTGGTNACTQHTVNLYLYWWNNACTCMLSPQHLCLLRFGSSSRKCKLNMFVCSCTHTSVHIHICTHTHVYIHICVCMHANTHKKIHTYVCTYRHTHRVQVNLHSHSFKDLFETKNRRPHVIINADSHTHTHAHAQLQACIFRVSGNTKTKYVSVQAREIILQQKHQRVHILITV